MVLTNRGVSPGATFGACKYQIVPPTPSKRHATATITITRSRVQRITLRG